MEEKDLNRPIPLCQGTKVQLLREDSSPWKKATVIYANPYCFVAIYRLIFFLPGLVWPTSPLYMEHEGKTWKRLP
jgi:hypothetical protein